MKCEDIHKRFKFWRNLKIHVIDLNVEEVWKYTRYTYMMTKCEYIYIYYISIFKKCEDIQESFKCWRSVRVYMIDLNVDEVWGYTLYI